MTKKRRSQHWYGKLDKDEVPERMANGFARIDSDGDGFLTKAEIEKMMSSRGQRGGGAGGPGGGRPGRGQGAGGDAPGGSGGGEGGDYGAPPGDDDQAD